MFHLISRRLILVILVLVVVAVPALVGCGGGGTSTSNTEIRIGLETDLTGPANSSIQPVYAGMQDYLKEAEAANTIPGVTVKIITYDQRSDYSRIPAGYVWLKGQGVKAIMFPSPTDIDMMATKFATDDIVALGTTTLTSWLNNPWCFGMASTMQTSSARCMKWIMDNWDYTGKGRNPKVGFIGVVGSVPTQAHQEGVETYIAAHPGKFDYLGSAMVPSSTSTFAGEIAKFASCDWIFEYFYQTTITTFVREARARGYKGNIMATSAAMPGYWNLVRAAMSANPKDLYGCYHVHYEPWCEDCAFATFWKSMISKYRSADYVATEGQSPSYATGIAWALWLVDVLKRAVATVGADKVDGAAIRVAAEATNMEEVSQGWANDWVMSSSNHILCTADKMYMWDVAQSKWVRLSDAIVVS
ncbi:MAG: ABC transporter substrate-binding protein [Chloroflexi bacterium]|nr:ABC transporter substrate-binding protein [Chloroflexota bacterium]